MRISQAIAVQSVALSVGIVLLAIATTLTWTHIGSAQSQMGENSLALKDFRVLEETTKSWLLTNDLIFASGQTHLVPGALRQSKQVIDQAKLLSETALAADMRDRLSELIDGVERNQAELEEVQYLSLEQTPKEYQRYLERWDQLSPAVVQFLEEQSLSLGEKASAQEMALADQRLILFVGTVLAFTLFGLLVASLWRWLTSSLARPLRHLSEAADKALDLGASLDLQSEGPDEVIRLSQSINAFVQTLEDRVADRTAELEDQKHKLLVEVERRKIAEEKSLRLAQEANSASEAKSIFLATMSHEIRTPLNGIIGSADLLLSKPQNKSVTSGLRTIQSSSDHLLELINMVLDFSKYEAKQMKLRCEEFPFEELLSKLRSIFSSRAIEKKVDFQFEIDPSIPQYVIGDALRIRQILTNLLSNAFTYTESGAVTLRIGLGESKSLSALPLVCEVQDTGIGIPKNQQASIFESFRQVEVGTTRRFGGTGLGLTVSQQLAGLMGGAVELVQSNSNGSIFRCTLQLERGFNESRPASTPIATPIVLAIQDQVLGDQVQRILTAENCTTVERLSSATGNEDVDSIAALSPESVVIVDHAGSKAFQQVLSEADAQGCRRVWLKNAFSSSRHSEKDNAANVLTPVLAGELLAAVRILIDAPDGRERPSDASSDELHGHVLLVEDNPVNQEVASAMLEKMGLSVSVASDGQEAVECFTGIQQEFNLVLMDMHMPIMDGLEAANEIRRIEALDKRKSVPIVFATADTREELGECCEFVGNGSVLAKPIKMDDLRRVLVAHLN